MDDAAFGQATRRNGWPNLVAYTGLVYTDASLDIELGVELSARMPYGQDDAVHSMGPLMGKSTLVAEPPGGDRVRTADKVDQALARLLASPEQGPGSKLPTERALADQLAVPRSAVRAALSRLEAQGRVLRIIGSGTYVADPSPAAGFGPDKADGRDASPREIMETRILLEPPLAALVVAHANGADIARIREAMAKAEAATDFDSFELWDGLFHQAIADATHNRLVIEVYRTITIAREHAQWGELKRRSTTPERRAVYKEEHREIVHALELRDTERAQAALQAHLVTVRRTILGS